jgi:[protein-PII] uridylyltransferase
VALTRSDPESTDPVGRLREQLSSLDAEYVIGDHGRVSARRRAKLMDACVVELYEATSPPARTALVALGGYGRSELVPHSDIDLLLLYGSSGWVSAWGARRTDAVKDVAEQLFYPLWDSGFAVGHAVRGVRESQRLASERLDAETAMLDARLLSGDESVFRAMQDLIIGTIRRDPAAFVRSLRRAAEARRATHGSVSHLLEPDVKEGAGGLRDIHTISWVSRAVTGDGLDALEAHGVLRRSERASLDEAEEFLIRVRSALHLETGKKTDRLHLELQPRLAEALRFGDEPGLTAPDALMRQLFGHARRVEHVRDAVFERVLDDGGPQHRQAIEETPEAVMAMFAGSATGSPLSVEALDQVEAVSASEEITWTPEITGSFLTMLRGGDRGARALEAMDHSGWLERFLPEWDAVRSRPQRDPFHRFTVDVHLLQTLAHAGGLLAGQSEDPLVLDLRDEVGDRDALLLGAFLHDVGKQGHGDHVTAGVEVAGAILERMGVDERIRDRVIFLVQEHLLLVDTATRRDLEDENLIFDVAARVGDTERLAALYLLTVADAAATGPHAWTPWRTALVHDLVTKVRHVLERGDMGKEAAVRLAERTAVIRRLLSGENPETVDRFLQTMPRGYVLTVLPERAVRHFRLVQPPPSSLDVRTVAEPGTRPGTYGLAVVAHDRPGLLSKIAGALALSGLSILTAQVFTTEDGVAVDLFEVEGAFEEHVDEERWRRFRTILRKALEGRLSLEYRVKEKRSFYPEVRGEIPVSVHVDNDASDFFTVIEVGAADRIGLLFDITRTLFELQLDVHVAKVATYGGRVVDAFYVRDVLGRRVEDAEHITEVHAALRARLTE